MKFIVKLHPEITIKSAPVRKRFTRLLESNIRLVLKHNDVNAALINQYDKLIVKPRDFNEDAISALVETLKVIPGIEQFLQVKESDYEDLEDIYQQVEKDWYDKLAGKTFCVRVKRRGKHAFTSVDAARYVGGGLNQNCETGGVKLHNPDVEIQMEIDNDKLLLIERRYKGLGGMPLPSQEDVLSLISGGYDSSVASFHFIRRGAKTHFCFFNLGGREHEIGVKQVCHFLWQKYSRSHKVKFVSVDFAPIVTEILEKVDNGYMGVILKRMMLRAAEIVANNLQINALVTGEALGQVSSQTLSNLHVIDQVTDKLVLRPLICSDKVDIINTAREIGTEEFAKSIPEYCGVISNKPTVKAVMEKVLEEEAKCDLSLIEKVVRETNVVDIKKIAEQTDQEVATVESVSELGAQEVLLDIRSADEFEAKPFELPGVQIKHIPFYRLETEFPKLDKNLNYYLYCDRGVMSKLQALLLQEHGYTNVKVYRP